jgi:hypothetical protein
LALSAAWPTAVVALSAASVTVEVGFDFDEFACFREDDFCEFADPRLEEAFGLDLDLDLV